MTQAAVASAPEVGNAPRFRRRGLTAARLGGLVLALMFLACVVTLPWSIDAYDAQELSQVLLAPGSGGGLMGTDRLGRSLAWRCALGGAISLGIGLAAAAIAVCIGTTWGMVSGYAGGRVDAVMMRIVDVLYGLPYILLVVLLSVALQAPENIANAGKAVFGWIAVAVVGAVMVFTGLGFVLAMVFGRTSRRRLIRRLLQVWVATLAIWGGAGCSLWLTGRGLSGLGPVSLNTVTLLIAIGAVSWLTLARVVRGQVLSIKAQPFVEAARATGLPPQRILLRHILPNLIGPIIVYTTLTVPQAILQESFLSFLGIGVQAPLPSWGNLAADGLSELNTVKSHPWLLAFPCMLLGVTLLALNFMGDGLRDYYDPRTLKAA